MFNVDDMVCDLNYKHQKVVWKSGTEVGLEDGSIYDVDDLEVVDHFYSHPLDRALVPC